MQLVLYSGFDNSNNESIDTHLVSMLPENPRIGYIPSNSDGYEPYFQAYLDYFSVYGVTRITPFCADKTYSADEIEQLLNNDAIYLSGGNTFYFLNILKKKNLLTPLIEYVHSGKVLFGESAGAILQTPNINLARVPTFDCDSNDVGVTDLTAMNLVNFEFFPHYPNLPDYDSELLEYSRENSYPILACPNGSGVVVDGDTTTFCGDVYMFVRGKKIMISSRV